MALISKKFVVIGSLALVSMVVFWQITSRLATPDVVPMASEETALVAPVVPTGDLVIKEESPIPVAVQVGEKKISTKTSYENPGGFDEVGFTLTVDKDGVITDATVDVLATNLTAKVRQETFAKELPRALKGKKLRDLEAIDNIGGSSLTTEAFNEVLPGLKSQL